MPKDTEFVFAKVQTNRATLSKYREVFQKNKVEDEAFVAPRPSPGQAQIYYFALLKLLKGSKNEAYFRAAKNFRELKRAEHKRELDALGAKWEL